MKFALTLFFAFSFSASAFAQTTVEDDAQLIAIAQRFTDQYIEISGYNGVGGIRSTVTSGTDSFFVRHLNKLGVINKICKGGTVSQAGTSSDVTHYCYAK